MDKRNIDIDPKTEANNMYKHIVCEAMLSPNSLPVHLSEPFNINVEFIRISQDWLDLELLDKKQTTVEKIKINSITSVDLYVNNPLSNSGGGGSGGSPMLTRSNSILTRGALGSNTSSDDLLSSGNGSPSASPKSSKASMLLGLDDDNGGGKKKPENKNTAILSPKFGLLARSASNNLLNVNNNSSGNGSKIDSGSSPTLSSSPSPSFPMSPPLNISGSSGSLSSSVSSGGSTLNISPSNLSTPRGGDGSSLSLSQSLNSSGLGSLSSGGSGGGLHYNQGFTIITKNINYTFNAPDKDGINHIMNSVKMLSQGRPYQEQLQQTFDAIVESIVISQACKIPIIPPLPTSPPPPPPSLFLVQNFTKQSEQA